MVDLKKERVYQQLLEEAKTDPSAAEVIADAFEEAGDLASAQMWRRNSMYLRGIDPYKKPKFKVGQWVIHKYQPSNWLQIVRVICDPRFVRPTYELSHFGGIAFEKDLKRVRTSPKYKSRRLY